MSQASPYNEKSKCLRGIMAVTLITLTGIAMVAAAALLLVQSASATTDVTVTNATVGAGELEALSSTPTAANNTNSNDVLGRLFMIAEFGTANINPINETYIQVSTASNISIIPPDATGTTINGTETANATLNILPNGLAISKGESLLVAEGDNNGAAEQENATSTFVGISRITPNGPEGGTGVVFFSTNSTGQLAFLDNMVGIMQSEFSPGGGIIRVWEWKGDGTLPFENILP
jgi:hypothetical protein